VPPPEIHYQPKRKRRAVSWLVGFAKSWTVWLVVVLGIAQGLSHLWQGVIYTSWEANEPNPRNGGYAIVFTPNTIEMSFSRGRVHHALWDVPDPGWRFGAYHKDWGGFFHTKSDLPTRGVSQGTSHFRVCGVGFFFLTKAAVPPLVHDEYVFAMRYWFVILLLLPFIGRRLIRVWQVESRSIGSEAGLEKG